MAEMPRRLGSYEILGALGKGGASTVFEAKDSASGRKVAIKILAPQFALDPEAVERFHREAKAVAQLTHPNIAPILDQGEDQGFVYLVREHVEGTSLDLLFRQRRLSVQEAVQVIKQVARALDAAHRAGIVHGDLNPRKILVSPTLSVVKLSEFGLSRVESVARKLGTSTTKEMSLATLSYLAPEQSVETATVDHRADIYALGVVFYEALTGRVPLGRFSLPSELNRELPPDIDPIVLKSLATEPAKRYASVAQFLEQIEKFEETMRFQLLDELKGLKRGTTKLLSPTSTLGKRMIFVFALLAAGLVGVGAWMLLHPVAPPPGETSAPAANVAVPARSAAQVKPEASAAPVGTAVTTDATTPAAPAPSTAPPVAAPIAEKPLKEATAKPRKESGTLPAAPANPQSNPADSRSKPAVDPAIADLEVARGKFDAKLFDQSLAGAQALVATYPGSPLAIDGYFLIARSQASLQRGKEALGTYVEIQSRFRNDPRAAEAAFQQAKLVQAADSKKTTEEARKLYADCAANYPASPWSARALAARAEIEREQRATVRDAALGATVPAALATLRDLTERFGAQPVAEKAWWDLGQMYEDLKRWDLASKAYEGLAQHFPKTRLDAWYQVAEIYERRLKDAAKAKSAYALVPATSPHYKDAQKKAGG
ncbi:MAG: protein kinase [Thermoanaerobaculia bacterium]